MKWHDHKIMLMIVPFPQRVSMVVYKPGIPIVNDHHLSIIYIYIYRYIFLCTSRIFHFIGIRVDESSRLCWFHASIPSSFHCAYHFHCSHPLSADNHRAAIKILSAFVIVPLPCLPPLTSLS